MFLVEPYHSFHLGSICISRSILYHRTWKSSALVIAIWSAKHIVP